ncbi:MAG TPA: glycosyltransferase family 39 protein [Burkholderiaceae bacterium]
MPAFPAPDLAPGPAPAGDSSGSRWTSPCLLLGLLALWLLATLGLRPLLLPDEGRYAEVARAMLHGDLWVPTLNGLPFFHKPPLFYWLDIVAMRVFGENVFAGRFGSFVGAWLMGAALLLAMRRWHGARAAAIALGVLATTPFFFVGAQYANHDMLVGGLIAAAVLAIARAVDEPPRVDLRWLVAGWVLCALALLAKGLIGIVLPMLIIGPWLIAQARWRQLLGLLHPLGLLAFALVGLPWFVAMQLRYPGFFDYFVIEQHFRRFAQTNFNNVHGVWFFIVLVPLLTLPWSAWLPAAIIRLTAGRDATLGLYAWWIIAVVGFFSIPSSKLIGYVLPALAPWCALLALAVSAPAAEGRRRVWPTVMGAAAVACVALVAVVAWKAPQSSRALALQLGAQMRPDDRVVMVDEYFYDVPFYARLTRPVVIASAWDDPELPQHDNWRKEVFDAASFDPALGRALLKPLATLDALTCGDAGAAVWFITLPDDAPRVAALNGAARVMSDRRAELWRVPARACP